ncbi:MAG TPA: hypothetical protein VHC97_12985 [Thermoanaerobaculia bacterium]|jgi:hypothetical protein|nr:hypothetical protein [Thermoanaerobaculia bacterium]
MKRWSFPLHVDWGCLIPIAGVVAAVAFGAAFWIGQRFSLATLAALAVFGAFIAFVVWYPRLQVTPSEIRVQARWARSRSTPLPTRIPLQDLQIESAEVVDLLARRDLFPHGSLLTGRSSGHGYPQGFYSLANGQHAVVLLSRWSGVLYLPTRTGEVWLASLNDARKCLEILRSLRGNGRA